MMAAYNDETEIAFEGLTTQLLWGEVDFDTVGKDLIRGNFRRCLGCLNPRSGNQESAMITDSDSVELKIMTGL